MDKRPYVQRARAESAEATRRRVLAAAQANLERGMLGALKVDDVAREAGVSRSTVYLLFGSRAGLFQAVARQLRYDAGFDRLVEAFALPDAREAIRASLREATCMLAYRPDLARGLFGLAAIDPDAVEAVAAFDHGRRPSMRVVARRLRRQGYLRPDVTIAEATQILTVVTSFHAFDELYTGLGLAPDVIADRLIAIAERSLCREPDRARRR
jgi:AcrR family transcriptional regulator